ncbi:MAG: hypothetical protein JSU94_14635 [Phycisphaerales bacterium]|nr:MAG: hypothetical protein JSU94_14635 [Phycisphaerales bacterium]
MRRVLLLLAALSLFVQGCDGGKKSVHAITAATRRIPEEADATGWPEEQPPEEDASAWPEGPPVSETGNVSTILNAAGSAGYIEAYTGKKSYLPGETVNFHVSTTAATYSIEILKEAWTRTIIDKVVDLPGTYHATPAAEQQPWRGAGWPVSYSWVVPPEWENGSYLARFRTTSGDSAYTYHPFIVRTVVPGSRSKVAFVMNYNTRNAYNTWGGKSLYYTRVSGDKHKAVAVSFLRPFAESAGKGKNYWGQWELTSQLLADGFDPEFLTEWDIHANPAILRAYDVLVFAGHHEYISCPIYDALEAHHHRGGHMAFFSANDIWWQVRYEDNGDLMVCYKAYAPYEDPIRGINDSLLTTHWHVPPVSRPGAALQGISYIAYSYYFEREDFIVQDSSHWIFEGTDLTEGDALGSLMASGETDDVTSDSPAIMDVILKARRDRPRPKYDPPVEHVNCAAVYYADSPAYGFPDGRGGQVFSAGTHEGWGDSIGSWSPGYQTVRKVTRNIIQHMVDSPPPHPDVQDLAAFLSRWLDECVSPDWCGYADSDMSGTVDMADFAHFAEPW